MAQRLAFSYVRYSSWQQRNSDSVKRQVEMVATWLEHHPDYVLSDESYHDYGKSGYHGKHLENAFGRLLAAVENGDIPPGSTILIEAIDRAGRLPPSIMLNLITEIVNAGVDLVSLDDGITYDRDPHKSNNLFLLVAKVQQAYQYSDALSRRLKATYQTKREKAAAGEGATRRMPLWIRDGKLRKDVSPAVNQLFEDYAAGLGERRILRRLKEKHQDFASVSPSTLRRWLRNPVAIGRWNDIENVWPAVVTKELWFRVQKRLADSSTPRAAAAKYLLTGLVKCSRCGKNYCVGGQKGTLTMLCVTRHRYGDGPEGCTNSKSIPYAVLDNVRMRTEYPALMRAIQGKKLTESEKRQIEIDGELTELRRQSANAAEGLVRFGQIQSIVDIFDRIEPQIKALEQEQLVLKSSISPVSKIDALYVDLNTFFRDPEMLNAMLQGAGYSMVVDDRTITVTDADAEVSPQVFRYKRTDRVNAIFEFFDNDGELVKIPNEAMLKTESND